MDEKVPKYIEGVGWRYETEHSKLRRMQEHDYHGRSIYMITMNVEGRRPLLGELRWSAEDGSDAHVEASRLGAEVERCWYAIREHYPEVELLAFQLMPDHVHGLLFVKKGMEAHLGQVVKGFKIGCSKAMWRIEEEEGAAGSGAAGSGAAGSGAANYNSPNGTAPNGTTPNGTAQNGGTESQGPGNGGAAPGGRRAALFEAGYQDSVLKGKGQLERMFAYIADNPRRLAVKRMRPDLFKVVGELTVGDRTFAAIGNRWLLDRPVRMQVRCHNNSTPENLRMIERQKAYFLERAAKGAVVVSPCISAGEKEIARAALDAKMPLIVILENGFAPKYKPPGRYFEACAQGLLLMMAPWPYHMETRRITREQCLELNEMARWISTEEWRDELLITNC